MSFLAPTAFFLSALVGPLVALYMLRSRRRRVVVPSLLLWDEAPRSVSSARPWERLRVTPLLLLQLLVLALFVVALARPSVAQRSLLGPHTVLIIDTSASMAQAGRFDRAVGEMRGLVAEASPDRLLSIVTGGPNPSVLAAFSSDPGALALVLDGLVPTGGPERLDDAIRLARGLATPDRATSTVLFSDGGSYPLSGEPIVGATHVTFHDQAPNVGITLFAPVPGLRGSAAIEMVNTGIDPVPVEVVFLVDDVPTTRLEVEVPGQSVARRQVEIDGAAGAVMRAVLQGVDGSALDDQAVYVVATEGGLGVQVVGERSLFLEALLRALPGTQQVVEGGSVVVVNGGPIPDTEAPMWLLRTDPPAGITVTGIAQNLVVGFQRPGEPLLDGVDLSDVIIGEADVVDVATPEHLQAGGATGWLPLFRAGDVPLFLLGEVNGRRAIYQTFLLEHSNLPVQVAFPLLARNTLDWLRGGSAAGGGAEPVGAPIVLPPGAVAVVTPVGEVDVSGLDRFDATHHPGIYRVTDAEGRILATVARSIDPSEIQAAPRTIATESASESAADSGTTTREWVAWLIGTVLVFSFLEWWVGHRVAPRREGSS